MLIHVLMIWVKVIFRFMQVLITKHNKMDEKTIKKRGKENMNDMNHLKIAFAQIESSDNPDENLGIAAEACRKAREQDADIVLFPEMFSCGYVFPTDNMHALNELALGPEDKYLTRLQDLARELEIAICITYLKKPEDSDINSGPENSLILVDRFGQKVLEYSKVHTCGFDAESVLSGGSDFFVGDLDTRAGVIKTGAMICFDREFPESARILMLKGAELVLAPNACPMEINRLSALRTRAYENKLAIATCNYPAGHPDCNGKSTLFDGIAWLESEPCSRDMCVFQAPEEGGIYIASLDLDLLRYYRTHEVMGEKYRHPEVYGELVKTESGQE